MVDDFEDVSGFSLSAEREQVLLGTALALFFMSIVVVTIVASARECYLIAAGRKAPRVHEAPFVPSRLTT